MAYSLDPSPDFGELLDRPVLLSQKREWDPPSGEVACQTPGPSRASSALWESCELVRGNQQVWW